MRLVRAKVRPGHPWVFANEILDPPVARLIPGETVRVEDPHGRPLGVGYANPRSLITIRLCGLDADIDSPAFYADRLRAALKMRQEILPGRRSYRLCAGEADGLPGLLIDRYEDVLSIQITSLGMDQRKDHLRQAIEEVIQPRAVVLRNDVGLRTLEGLPLEKLLWWGEQTGAVRFEENGAPFEVDLLEGQKTGFFFDQAENRAWAAQRCAGARVLDVFAYVGAFAVQAMRAGATEAIAVDSSALACQWTRRNAELSGVEVKTMEQDAKDAMSALGDQRFDIVSVDPPAFAKSRKTAAAALVGYRNINAQAMKLVRPGGLLFASSCSHHIHPERFAETMVEAAERARREIVLVRRGGQAPDHPILPGVPETEYLKHLVFLVR